MWLVLFAFLAVIGGLLFLLIQKITPPPTLKNGPPRVETSIPLIGPAISFGMDPVGTLTWAKEKYGPVFNLNLLLFDATFLLSDAGEGGGNDDVNYHRYFNAKEADLDFSKGVEKFMRPIFNIPDQSALPKEQVDACHAVMRNGLGMKYLPTYCRNAMEIAETTFFEWSQRPGGEIDLQEAVSDLIASINVCNFMGKESYRKHWKQFAEAMLDLEQNGTSPLALMLPWLPSPAIQKCRKARATISAIMKDELERRQREGHKDEVLDFLQQFVDKKVGDGEYVPMELRLDTMIAVFFGAHHNTVNTLTWLIARLHEQRPPIVEIFNKVVEEQDKVVGDIPDEELATTMYDKIEDMNYLEQCMKEVSRLYFTVMLPPRKVVTPFRVETMEIPVGSYLCISPIVSHLDGNIFPESVRFFPGRWDPKHGKNPFGMAYVQFGYGKHRCTGERYALTLIKSLMSLLLKKYKVTMKDPLPDPIFSKAIGTASPKKKIIVKITRK